MLGRLEMSVDECIKTYTELSKDVFHKTRRIPIGFKGDLKERYDSEALEQAVKKVLRDRGVDEDTQLKNPQGTKVFVCCTSGETSQTAVLRTWHTTRGDSNLYKTVRIWEAARATSAASTFFDSITIGEPGQRFLDGGTGANNSVRHTWNEATDVLSRQGPLLENLGCLISIGTGQPGYKRLEETVQGIGKALLEIATETETTANEFHREHSGLFKDKICFRFNVPRGLGDIGLAETEQISDIKSMTDHYLQTEAVQGDIQICVQQLGERQIRPATQSSEMILQAIDRVSQNEDEDFCALSEDTRWQLADSKNDVLNLLERISEYQPQREHCKINMQKTPGTTCWIVEEILSWVDESEQGRPDYGRCLWLSGIVGCGKTFLVNTAIQSLLDRNGQQRFEVPVAHFYFDPNKHDTLTTDALLRSYVKQLLRYAYKTQKKPSVTPGVIRQNLLKPLIQGFESSFLIVDGLDLCPPQEYKIALDCFSSLLQETSVKVIICGRHELDVARRFPGSVRFEVTHEKVADDVALFVDGYMEESIITKRPLSNNASTMARVKEGLVEQAKEMFLWARLQIDVPWDTCNTDAQINHAMSNLPKDLDETYMRCLNRVQNQQQQYCLPILRYVYAARTPLKIDALGEALAIDLETGELIRDQIPFHYTILRSGANLIMFDEVDNLVVPTHDSVRKFLDGFKERKDEDLNALVIDDATLDLGEVCIAHLLWHASENGDTETTTGSARKFNTNQRHLPSIEQMGNWTKPPPRKLTSLMNSLILKNKVTTASKPYRSFREYARKNWTLLTCGFTEKTADWTRFKSFISLDTRVENGRSNAELFPWRVDGTESPLGWAISEGHLALLELSSTSSQQMLSQPLEHYGGLSPLHLASKRGRLEIVKKLYEMKRPRYVDLSPKTGRTALHYAAEQGHFEIVDFLLQSKTRTDWKALGLCDREDHTAIDLAIIPGSCATIETMNSKASSSIWFRHRTENLLDALIAGGSQPEVVDMVLDRLISREHQMTMFRRIISWVLANENLSLIPNLIKAGVSLDVDIDTERIDSDGKQIFSPAIFFALEASTPVLATAFIEHGVITDVPHRPAFIGRATRVACLSSLLSRGLIDMTGSGGGIRSVHIGHLQLRPIDIMLSHGWTSLASRVFPTPQDCSLYHEAEMNLLVTNTEVQWSSLLMTHRVITSVACSTHDSCAFAAKLADVVKFNSRFLYINYQNEEETHSLNINTACLTAERAVIELRVMMGTAKTTVSDWRDSAKSDFPLRSPRLGHAGTLKVLGYELDLEFNDRPYNFQAYSDAHATGHLRYGDDF
ncbi:ankyrin, partial [Aureobasidium melanogenum]